MKSMYWRHDWAFSGDKPKVRVEWRLLRRVFAYFVPYWPSALVVLACIGVAAAVGLVPAIVTRTLIDYLDPRRHGHVSFVIVLILALVAASVAGGLIRVPVVCFPNPGSPDIKVHLLKHL